MEIMRKESFQLILERHQQSGLSVTDFCQNKGYNRSSFYQWMKKFGLSTKYVRNKYSTVMAADADFAPVRFSSNNKTDRTINTPGEIMISFSYK